MAHLSVVSSDVLSQFQNHSTDINTTAYRQRIPKRERGEREKGRGRGKEREKGRGGGGKMEVWRVETLAYYNLQQNFMHGGRS